MRRVAAVYGAVGFALAASVPFGAARADGLPPFYGYSDYFGGPAVYYSHDTDVQQSTRPVNGVLGIGIRSYARGGPFWAYKPTKRRVSATRRSRYIVTKG